MRWPGEPQMKRVKFRSNGLLLNVMRPNGGCKEILHELNSFNLLSFTSQHFFFIIIHFTVLRNSIHILWNYQLHYKSQANNRIYIASRCGARSRVVSRRMETTDDRAWNSRETESLLSESHIKINETPFARFHGAVVCDELPTQRSPLNIH